MRASILKRKKNSVIESKVVVLPELLLQLCV